MMRAIPYMPKFGLDFNISHKQYLGVEWSGKLLKRLLQRLLVKFYDYGQEQLSNKYKNLRPILIKGHNANNVTLNYEWTETHWVAS